MEPLSRAKRQKLGQTTAPADGSTTHAEGQEWMKESSEDEDEDEDEEEEEEEDEEEEITKVIAQFKSKEGVATGPQLELPLDITPAQLQVLINSLLENEEKCPYAFFLDEQEITASLMAAVQAAGSSVETVLPIVYQPQAIFRVKAVTRCTATIPGHEEAVLHVSFSSCGRHLASGSGDTTVRVWDVDTETPRHTMKGHKNWVMAVAWSPDGKMVASGGMDKMVMIWDPVTGKRKGKPYRGHSKWITCLAWEPMQSDPSCRRVASGSKDGSVKVWDTATSRCMLSLTGHSGAVKAIKWGGQNLIYSASADRTIRVWETTQGKLVRVLSGHAHWVNCLSLNTDHALRTGAYDHKGRCPDTPEEVKEKALQKYKKVAAEAGGRELLVSGSDDFTLFLWDPVNSKKPILRMTGHQQPVNYVCYSPDGRYIASASFDKSVKLWNGITGKFITSFRGHVQSVYQVCWSGDSRLVCSSSKDSTLKVWEVRTKKMLCDLPGHADEVYAVDWSPDGERVASGGKDKVLKMWRR